MRRGMADLIKIWLNRYQFLYHIVGILMDLDNFGWSEINFDDFGKNFMSLHTFDDKVLWYQENLDDFGF